MLNLRLIMVLMILLGLPATSLAAGRVALVVGNSNYSHAPSLPNPVNDAADISEAFARLGFDVTTVNDLGFDAMRKALRRFNSKASQADMAVIFYAGHGMEVNKQNYLVPADAKLQTDRDISFEAIPLGLVTEAVSGAKTLRLVILDACRDNPFASSMKMTSANRSLGRGLARIEPAAGTLVSFAAKEGTVALDGSTRNSPYTKALLRHLETPQLEINFLFREVRDAVMQDTNSQQQPFTYGSLGSKRIYLNQGGAPAVARPEPSQPQAPKPPAQDGTLELALWNEVKNSNDANMLGVYLQRYPSGVFSGVARQRIENLQRPKEPEPPKPERVVRREPVTRTIQGPQGTIHLGDENIRGWARVTGLCVSIPVPEVPPGGLVRLHYRGFGVEDAYATLGNLRKSLPRMPNRGRRRPNYWSGTQTVDFPLRNGYSGGQISICSAKVRNPEKPGDRDDLQLQRLSVEVRG